MSFRALSRALPRASFKPSILATSRSFCSPARLSPLLRSSYAAPVSRYAAFSTSRAARQKSGDTDIEVSAKLQEELDMEREMRDSEKLPTGISDYLESSAFELHDKPGSEEVTLTRKFGDEHIRITFSIADLNNMDPEDDAFDEDAALGDEDDPLDTDGVVPPSSAQSGGANTKGAINQGKTSGGNIKVAPEDQVAASDRGNMSDMEAAADEAAEEAASGPEDPSFPARINVSIEKKGKGTLQIETTAQDGQIQIDSVNYFKDTKLAEPSSAESQWKRSGLYEGPPFANLDADLQVLLEKYLDERGINTQLALWVPEYIDFKEQREYLGWLGNVKEFVDA